HQVLPDTPELTPRTLPSAMPTCMATWAVVAMRGSHCDVGPVNGFGENTGLEPGPMLIIRPGMLASGDGGWSQNVVPKPGYSGLVSGTEPLVLTPKLKPARNDGSDVLATAL